MHLNQNKHIRIIISGGGTGGHVFPAIAIANALKRRVGMLNILFVGAKGKMEMEKVPEAGYRIIGLNIAGIQRRLTLKNFAVPFKLMGSLLKAKRIIKRYKPDVVIGVGGYASGPVLRVATKRKIPTLIQEQNSFPGLTNRILGKKVNKICVAYSGMEKYFPTEKIYLTGNPVRQEIQNIEGKREKALEYFGLNPDQKVLLIVGGSQGALSINEGIKNSLELLAQNNIQVIWQTGKYFHPVANKAVENHRDKNIEAYEFISAMDLGYAAADVIVSRAGAIAVSEISLVNKPAILIPLPTAAEDHQTKNAISLVNHNAAILVKDSEARTNLGKVVLDLINDEEKQNKIKQNLAGLAFKNSADKIASVIISLIKENNS